MNSGAQKLVPAAPAGGVGGERRGERVEGGGGGQSVSSWIGAATAAQTISNAILIGSPCPN